LRQAFIVYYFVYLMRRPSSDHPEHTQDFAKFVRKLRKDRNLSLTQAATETELSRAYINNVERAISIPQLKKWVSLAQTICSDQTEYTQLRSLYLRALGLKETKIEALPEKFAELMEIDPNSPALPNGIIAAINVRSSREGHDLAVQQISNKLDRSGITHEVFSFSEKTSRMKEEPNETREGLADILIQSGDFPLPLFLVLTQPGKNYQRAWFHEIVGRVSCGVDFYRLGKAIVVIDGTIPEAVDRLSERPKAQGIFFTTPKEVISIARSTLTGSK
jgi:transcriptional regulator with XRE-family HTH domain